MAPQVPPISPGMDRVKVNQQQKLTLQNSLSCSLSDMPVCLVTDVRHLQSPCQFVKGISL